MEAKRNDPLTLSQAEAKSLAALKSFDVKVEKVLGTVHLGGKGRRPVEVAFGLIGRELADTFDTLIASGGMLPDEPVKFTFTLGGITATLNVDLTSDE